MTPPLTTPPLTLASLELVQIKVLPVQQQRADREGVKGFLVLVVRDLVVQVALARQEWEIQILVALAAWVQINLVPD